jgi:hypothetical protein
MRTKNQQSICLSLLLVVTGALPVQAQTKVESYPTPNGVVRNVTVKQQVSTKLAPGTMITCETKNRVRKCIHLQNHGAGKRTTTFSWMPMPNGTPNSRCQFLRNDFGSEVGSCSGNLRR